MWKFSDQFEYEAMLTGNSNMSRSQSFQFQKESISKSNMADYPSFSDLPLQKDGPHGNAWGLWGPEDQVGTLNHLTAETVAKAAAEQIKSGKSVSLKYVKSPSMDEGYSDKYSWALTGSSYPLLSRKTLDLKIINKAPLKIAHDDEVFPLN